MYVLNNIRGYGIAFNVSYIRSKTMYVLPVDIARTVNSYNTKYPKRQQSTYGV